MNDVLIVAPHADDEILGVGGTIQKHLDINQDVHVIIVCDRQHHIAKQREQSIEAITHLGVAAKNITHLGLPDEKLDSIGSQPVIKLIEEKYLKILPSVVYYCHKDDVNTDHYMVNKACNVVTRPLQQHAPRKVLLYEVPSSTNQSFNKNFKPNSYSVLTNEQLENKIQSMYCYTHEIRDNPNPRNKRGLRVYAKFRGMECNHEFAEAFECLYDIT